MNRGRVQTLDLAFVFRLLLQSQRLIKKTKTKQTSQTLKVHLSIIHSSRFVGFFNLLFRICEVVNEIKKKKKKKRKPFLKINFKATVWTI